jgi:hypothetical protein
VILKARQGFEFEQMDDKEQQHRSKENFSENWMMNLFTDHRKRRRGSL